MVGLPETFTDGIGPIALFGGVVRIDLVGVIPNPQAANNQPDVQVKHRLYMPLEGFLRSFSRMEEWVNQLVEAGVIRKNEKGANMVGATGVDQPPPKSPNFS